MPRNLEADVALLHVTAGGLRATPPPGALAQVPPRRAARGRSDDLYFVVLATGPGQPVTSGMLDQLARQAASVFYATPGPITTAMREAASEVNDHLVNLARSSGDIVEGSMMQGVLRGADLYLAQSGAGQALVVRRGQVTRLSTADAEKRPLGQSASPFLGYQHTEALPEDFVLLTAGMTPPWSDGALSALNGLTPQQALERLGAESAQEVRGVFIRVAAPGQPVSESISAAKPEAPAPSRAGAGLGEAAQPMPAAIPHPGRSPSRPRPKMAHRPPSPLTQSLGAAGHRLRTLGQAASLTATRWLARLAPGLAEPTRPGLLPPTVLAATAIAVPLIVVVVVSLVYLRRGRAEQFQEYMLQAQAAVITAKMEADPALAAAAWEQASQLLDLAANYGTSESFEQMQAEVRATVDGLNKVFRTEFFPAVSGGFGSGAQPIALAASSTDLYVLDVGRDTLWHTWATGRGYEIDRDFECYGTVSLPDLADPVDITLQAAPGALGTEGVVVIDPDGTVMYCAPGATPLLTQLTPPDVGWRQIRAIDVFKDRLYVLDPAANAVWMVDASDGLFTGSPTRFFDDLVPDLTDAIDLEMAQDELFILMADGELQRCRRKSGATECTEDLRFTTEQLATEPTDRIPGATPIGMVYAPPPEPSLYFLDAGGNGVFHYSMRLVYQGLLVPEPELPGEPLAITYGPPGDLFLAVGSQVYYAQPQR